MVKRAVRLRLLDITTQVAAIEAAIAGLSLADFRSDWLRRSAVERGIEVISEASRHIDPALTVRHPEVPWRRVADIGNWLRHAYEQVDPALIWFIVIDEFPALKAAIADMLAATPED
ncbi:HepT-like ribonuclease domain-containing protein [Polymorphobacter fuscus]|uniref:DUF86 domain-containing protein n=1 Tax=Sandarakinorhabdus fusca TaxID=1439888 RepID=A0A7C9LH91_9SPHN|nr:HepT-like ribonuclease domain-containing protein [Polymorphobacter fuscus]KAB7644815.1 DUF86 domain-containing protein [Polymorphobacter fuscus]MQT18087.1 DUF86 domain-containing protein [Polymorphobacter fuscus]NJC09405.1 uncharacterized protein with HEPN domain [Polymorphobacter fuscus]